MCFLNIGWVGRHGDLPLHKKYLQALKPAQTESFNECNLGYNSNNLKMIEENFNEKIC